MVGTQVGWRRLLVGAMTAALLATALPGMAAAADTAPAATMPANPQTVLVPLRVVAEAVGATVQWDAATETVTVTRGDAVLVVRIGQATATLNGQSVPLGAPIGMANERTMIPLNVLKAALGVEVAWDAKAGAPVVDQLGTRALDLAKVFWQGAKPDPTQFTDGLRAVLTDRVLAIAATQMKPMGAVKQMGVIGHSSSAVHQNVEIVVAQAQVAWTFTVRFDKTGKIDDFYSNVYQPAGAVAGTPAYADPKAYTETEVVVGEGTAFPLPGTLTMPAGDGPFPLVVLVHGSGPNDRDESVGGVKVFRDLAQGLASRKIAVLRYEKRTREHSQKSQGNPKFGVQDETVTDALAAVQLATKLPGVDPKRIYMLGHSQGGYLIPQIIGQDTARQIKGAVIAAGPNSFLDILIGQNKILAAAKMTSEAQVALIEGQVAMVRDAAFDPANPPKGYMIGSPYYFKDISQPAGPIAAKQSTPLFIYQGGRDFQVQKEQLDAWKKDLAARSDVTYQLYPKLNHLFTEGEGEYGLLDEYTKPQNVAQYVVEDIAAWVQSH